MVIDIDSHFEPGDDWLDEYPELGARRPKLPHGLSAVEGIAGDLLRDVPEDQRPPLEDLTPPGLLALFAQKKAGEAKHRDEFEGENRRQVAGAAARLECAEAQGVQIQNAICLAAFGCATYVRERGSRIFLIPDHPVNGVSTRHPDRDRLWSAAT